MTGKVSDLGDVEPPKGPEEEIVVSRTAKKSGLEGVRETGKSYQISGEEEEYETEQVIFTRPLARAEEVFDELLLAEEVERIPVEKVPSLDDWAGKHGEALMEEAFLRAEAGIGFGEAASAVAKGPSKVSKIVQRDVYEPMEHFIDTLSSMENVAEKIADGIAEAQLIFRLPGAFAQGGNLILKRTVLKALENQLELVENKLKTNPDANLEKKVHQMKYWLTIQNDALTQQAKTFGIDTLSYIPHAIKEVTKYIGHFSKWVQYGDAWLLGLTMVVTHSFAVHKARMGLKTHREFVEKQKKPEIVQPIESALKVEAQQGEFPTGYLVPKAPEEMAQAVKALVVKRKEQLDDRVAHGELEFGAWAVPLAQSYEEFSEIKAKFKEKGVDLDALSVPITDKDELGLVIAGGMVQNPVKVEMVKSFVEHKQTISALTRNGIKALTEKKHAIERKFMHFRLTKSSITLGLSTAAFIATIVFKTLAIIGTIALPVVALAWTGIGIFAAGAILFVIGLIFLKRSKLNLFRALVRGVQLRLALKKIPYSIQKLRLHRTQLARFRKSIEAKKFGAKVEIIKGLIKKGEAIEAKNLPIPLRPLLKKLNIKVKQTIQTGDLKSLLEKLETEEKKQTATFENEAKNLDAKIVQLNAKVEEWEQKMAPLQKRLRDANWKDFQRTSGLKRTAPKLARVLVEEEQGPRDPGERLVESLIAGPAPEGRKLKETLVVAKESEYINLEETLVYGILYDEEVLDPQMKSLVQDQLGIDLEDLRSRSPEDKEQLKKDLSQAIGEFFSLGDTAIVQFIKDQQAKKDMGV